MTNECPRQFTVLPDRNIRHTLSAVNWQLRIKYRSLGASLAPREIHPSCKAPEAAFATLERFSNTYVLTDSIEGGFFLRKKPLCGVVSVYSNWRTAIAARIRCGAKRE